MKDMQSQKGRNNVIFNLFRKGKTESVSLEMQIQTLIDLGVTFNLSDAELIKGLTDQFDRQVYEEDPYRLLISVAGTDLLDNNGNELRLSYDILSFDTECVEDEYIYTDVITQFLRLAKLENYISELDSKVNFNEETAYITFLFEQKRYKWNISFDSDWFDVSVLERMASVIERPNMKFIYFNDGQHLTLMYCSKAVFKQINNLTKNKFRMLA
ncbi:hypothetical protein [Paenibacillus sp.]|uniref:hypothetical protein n=1 Tax=Paenibacillus sp. TaxID=58172 RepID=UPI002D5921C9|nr:hypothetical protein [Paenibacillus sp.]HZG86680.1 hypothetical protein [Paenibacillus sp.]